MPATPNVAISIQVKSALKIPGVTAPSLTVSVPEPVTLAVSKPAVGDEIVPTPKVPAITPNDPLAVPEVTSILLGDVGKKSKHPIKKQLAS